MTEQGNFLDLLRNVGTVDDLVDTFPPNVIGRLGGGEVGKNRAIALVIGLAVFAPEPAKFDRNAFNAVVPFDDESEEPLAPQDSQAMVDVAIELGFLKPVDEEGEWYMSNPDIERVATKLFKD